MNLAIDNDIIKILINNDIFKDVHPNIITFIGIICNLLIIPYVYHLDKEKINFIILGILFAIRWVADGIDGAIARKYNKKSKLGNKLDTLSDWMFQFIMACALIIIFDLPIWTIIIFFIMIYVEIKRHDILETHDKLKQENVNIYDNIIKFTTNNSIIFFVIIYSVLIYYNSKKF